MTWDPDTYPTTIRAEIHDYEELQEQVVQATAGVTALSILDLGVGAGETAVRLLRMHSDCRLIGIDSSPEMLRAASRALPEERVMLLEQDLAALSQIKRSTSLSRPSRSITSTGATRRSFSWI